MSDKELLKGNEALAEAAIRAGCRAFFSYPITPATEILEYMAVRMPQVGGVFVQPESELASINMVIGAACAGERAMTSSSSTGISLMQEGISSLAASELPGLIVNIMRASPGLGTVPPSQADYFQATRGGGHGDYHLIALAPSSVQEMADLTVLAFELADRYRNPAIILADGMIGQMMEPVTWKEITPGAEAKPWATTGAKGRERNLILSAPFSVPELINLNKRLNQKYKQIAENEQRWENYLTEDAELILVAFGTVARVGMEAVDKLRNAGLKVGLIRPITVWPFPAKAFTDLGKTRAILCVEMNNGQMVDDIRLVLNARIPVHFYGFGGGWIPDSRALENEIEHLYQEAAL
jgi:2-oxoglutarate/2-oxoacid ferredoxin oxidoreductase subunit alpha